jgi:hypothetical protein
VSDFGKRISQPLLMVELHIGDDARQRRDDIRGVEPPAHAGFPNHQVAFLFGEVTERHHRDNFEESWMFIRGEFFEHRLQVIHKSRDVGFADELSIHLNSLGETDQVRRGEQSDTQPSGSIDTLQHRAT